MKKRLIFVLFCSGIIMNLAAQKIEVKEPQLVKEAGTEAYYPKFTPDGKTILLTSINYAGLKTFNLETKKVKQLTADAGAGWNLAISDDSKTVCFQKIDMSRDLVSFHSCNLETQKFQQLTTPESNPATRPLLLMKSKAALKSPVIAYTSEDLQIVVEKNGKKTVLTPNGTEESYIWVQLSPDGTKIVYHALYLTETFICDLSGKILSKLGRLHAPQWLNNDWIVGMNDLDDGHNVLNSNIVAATSNGKVKQDLTHPNAQIAMYPAVSPAGDKIAFNTLDGKLYIMDVVVK